MANIGSISNASPHRHYTVPPSLRPLLRAYALGYVSVTGPRLFGFLRVLSRRKVPLSTKLNLLYKILATSAEPNRFPAACAITVGGATALPRLIRAILQWLLLRVAPEKLDLLGPRFMTRLRFITSFFSAYLAFHLMNKDPSWSRKRALSMSRTHPNEHHKPTSPTEFAGKTIDLTLFAFIRALDAASLLLWTSTSSSPRHPTRTHPTLTRFLTHSIDPLIFSLSAAVIMHSWFYSPERLPRGYRDWITTAADIDPRIIEVLRRARRGEFVYGVETGQADLLGSLCRDLHLPEHWGDPVQTIPVPCELYHTGSGPNCEVHALNRFLRSFVFAFRLYLPLTLLPRIMNLKSLTNLPVVKALLKSAVRSSTFLASFIALFYYFVCLARTRIGPNVIPLTVVTRQMYDSGLCVLAGCMACGWSVLVEKEGKRQELAFFVAPRALGTILPRVYDKKYITREKLVFATSMAVVLTSVKAGGKRRVRGVLGQLLESVIRE